MWWPRWSGCWWRRWRSAWRWWRCISPRPFTRRPESIPSSSCSTTCPGVFSSPRWRSERACWPPWPSFGTTFSAVAAGPSGGGDPLAANRPLALFRRGFERGLTQSVELAVALEHETAAVEGGERGAVADRHDRGAPEPCVEKAVERGFRRLVERSRRLVEEKIIRCLQNGAGNAEALLLAEREHSVPVRFLREPPGERGQADGGDDLGERVGSEGSGLGGIGDRGRQRTDREIRSLRQRHQLGPFGHPDGARAERPSARDRPQQGRLARARRTGEQHPLARRDGNVVGGDQRCALRQPHQKVVDFDAISALARRYHDRRRRGGRGLRPLGRDVEAVESRDHRPPLRELAVGVDDKRQRALHAGERGGGLHQPAELNRSGKIGGTDHDEGKDDRDLRVARGQKGQLLGTLHDQEKVADDVTEAIEQSFPLGGFSSQQRDLL